MNNEHEISDESPVQNEQLESKTEEAQPSSSLAEFLAKFEQISSSEEKIRLAIEFMRTSLSQAGNPHFKDFGLVRRHCLAVFKESINPKLRSHLWSEYIELSSEARKLKEILEEQSAFAVEQIELAIQAMENDLQQYDHLLSHVPKIFFPNTCPTILSKNEFYNQLQRELHLLNTLASRVGSLRKEVLKTEMRIRHKNRFFERLSSCGDRIFPRRKELIKKISDEFIADVQHFIEHNFQGEPEHAPPFFILREEIKALQGIAKQLTLNTHSFTETRLSLSVCWDKIKHREKERKKEMAEKKVVFKQNFDLAEVKVFEAKEALAKEETTLQELNDRIDQVLEYMRSIELGREEIKILKDELQFIRRDYAQRHRDKELEREKQVQEVKELRKEKLQDIRQQLQSLIQEADKKEIQDLTDCRDSFVKEIENLSLTKAEKFMFDRLFKELKDKLSEKEIGLF